MVRKGLSACRARYLTGKCCTWRLYTSLSTWETCFRAIDLGWMSSAMIIALPLLLLFTYNKQWSAALIAYLQTAFATEHDLRRWLCSKCDLKIKVKRFVASTLKFSLNIYQQNKRKKNPSEVAAEWNFITQLTMFRCNKNNGAEWKMKNYWYKVLFTSELYIIIKK